MKKVFVCLVMVGVCLAAGGCLMPYDPYAGGVYVEPVPRPYYGPVVVVPPPPVYYHHRPPPPRYYRHR
jgi:hypothetical protein